MEYKEITTEVFKHYPAYTPDTVREAYSRAIKTLSKKIIVLDDDPTGVQTVHDIYVYTDWSTQSIRQGFLDAPPMFFILTNSRGLTKVQTAALHCEIAENIAAVSKELGREFILISRGDSTLRGHYPLETEVLRQTMEESSGLRIDGEILFPFFPEGGRYTVGDVHYVADGERLTPAGETEFAKDRTFGYQSSDLKSWIAEKSEGVFPAKQVVSITLEELRAQAYPAIMAKLMGIQGFGKAIVNAISYEDVMVFATALIGCLNKGKNFIFRTAAAFTKVIGNVSDQPLLTREQLVNTKNKNGGIIVVGSHVNKTTQQLERLKADRNIRFVEFNQHLVLDDARFSEELSRVISEAEGSIAAGNTVAVYTRRDRFDLNTGSKEAELEIAVKISDAVTGIVASLNIRPNFIIAKGGITSSDIGTKALGVKRAKVMGQILAGVPVWLTGEESKFPGLPYVIFPGNVGSENALLDAVEKMRVM